MSFVRSFCRETTKIDFKDKIKTLMQITVLIGKLFSVGRGKFAG